MRYHGHKQEVRLLLPLGDQLISADSGGDVIVWDVQEGGKGGGASHILSRFFPLCPLVTHHALLSLRRLPEAAV